MKKFAESPLEFLIDGATSQGEEVALIAGNTVLTWKMVYEDARSIASWLIASGLKARSRVAVVSGNNVECFILLYAVWMADGIAAPLNISLPLKQRLIILEKLNPALCLFGRGETVYGDFPWKNLTVPELLPMLSPDIALSSPSPDDTAMIMFTSGSTGVPKGVLNSHRALAMNAILTAEALQITGKDRILINTPAYYTSAIIHLLTLFSQGGSLVTCQGFLFGNTFVELIEKNLCTGFGGAPAHFTRIFTAIVETQLPKFLRFVMSSGDHLSVYLIESILDAFPHLSIYCVYGLTEVAGRLCIMPPEMLREKPGSVGRPLSGMKVTVCKEGTYEPAAPEEPGEIFVKGEMLTREYFLDEITSSALRTPAGFRTGDIGFLDKDGYLYVLGRSDDIFKSGGEKVSALMIQQTLLSFQEFNDVAVIPVKDAILGKVPVVFFVPHQAVKFDKRKLINNLRQILPHTHIPNRFIEVERIPRTGSGKVVRDELCNFL